MIRKNFLILLAAFVLAVGICAPVYAGDLAELTKNAVAQAQKELGSLEKSADVACLTNAGYAEFKGKSTLPVLDLLAKETGISFGKGNLLVRPGKPHKPLYFLFIKKQGPEKLMATYGVAGKDSLKMQPALDIFIGKNTSFKPFGKVFGKMAFNLVTLANGWAMGLPRDIMRGALIHGHLCCGVFTGYFTTRFMEKNIPLKKGEHYIYVGAPAWCQDDYIIDYLRLTPGTHGYVTMAFHWSKSWQTAKKTYDKLGGVVVRYNSKTNQGKAYVLSFDWHHDLFRKYMSMPNLKMDWRNKPWLHNAYDRFFMTKLDQPELFVGIHSQSEIKNKKDLMEIIGLGANPLAKLLGPEVK